VNEKRTGRREGSPKVDAPLRKEQAILDISVTSPPIFVTKRSQLLVETSEVESAYTNSRKAVEGAGERSISSNLTDEGVANQILGTVFFPGTYNVTQKAGRKIFLALTALVSGSSGFDLRGECGERRKNGASLKTGSSRVPRTSDKKRLRQSGRLSRLSADLDLTGFIRQTQVMC